MPTAGSGIVSHDVTKLLSLLARLQLRVWRSCHFDNSAFWYRSPLERPQQPKSIARCALPENRWPDQLLWKERNDRSGQCRENWGCFLAFLFHSVSLRFTCGFHSVGNSPNDRANRYTNSKKDCCYRHAVFFEDLFGPLSKRHGSFSSFNLRLQTRKLLGSFCHSSFRGFFVRRWSCHISENFLVWSWSICFKLGFLLFQIIQRLCGVESFFHGVSFGLFGRKVWPVLINMGLYFFLLLCLFNKDSHLFFAFSKSVW